MVSSVCVSHSNIDMNKFSLMKPLWKVAIKSSTLRGMIDCFTKTKKTLGKKCLSPPVSCLLSPISCLLSPASNVLSSVSCFLFPASSLMPPVSSCLLSPVSYLLPPVLCRRPGRRGTVMRRTTCAWHCVRVRGLCVHVRAVGGGRDEEAEHARMESAVSDWLRGIWYPALWSAADLAPMSPETALSKRSWGTSISDEARPRPCSFHVLMILYVFYGKTSTPERVGNASSHDVVVFYFGGRRKCVLYCGGLHCGPETEETMWLQPPSCSSSALCSLRWFVCVPLPCLFTVDMELGGN